MKKLVPIEHFMDQKIDASRQQCSLLERFAALVLEWNRRINLISRKDSERMIGQHIIDCALPLPLIPDKSPILDLGSGAGLPGIVLAILRPGTAITLSETREKKNKFLQNCIQILNLDRVSVLNPSHQKPERAYPLLVSRAFGPLDRIRREAEKYLSPGGVIAAYKGKRTSVESELERLPVAVRSVLKEYEMVFQGERFERTMVLLQDKQGMGNNNG